MDIIVDGLLALLNGLFTLFPQINITIDTASYLYFVGIISSSLHFLPINTCVTLLTFIVSLWFFRFVVHLVKTVWSMIKPV